MDKLTHRLDHNSRDDDRPPDDDGRAWLVIAAIDVIATAAVVGVYAWFLAHAAA